jgi:cytochrome c-type biogenesis protein CcmH
MTQEPGVVLFASLLSFAGMLGSAPAAAQSRAAHALEERLVAPCCWSDTLATHDSPLAVELRGEIEARLSAGEPAAAIEADLVGRYGARIRNTPPELRGVPWLIAGASLLTIAFIAWVALRWKRGSKRPPERAHERGAEQERGLDARIDAELDALDRG